MVEVRLRTVERRKRPMMADVYSLDRLNNYRYKGGHIETIVVSYGREIPVIPLELADDLNLLRSEMMLELLDISRSKWAQLAMQPVAAVREGINGSGSAIWVYATHVKFPNVIYPKRHPWQ